MDGEGTSESNQRGLSRALGQREEEAHEKAQAVKKSAAKWALKDLVEVDWIDSAIRSGWSDVEIMRQKQDIAVCRSVGYLLSADRRMVRLVGSQSAEPGAGVCDGMSIPRAAVTAMRRIR